MTILIGSAFLLGALGSTHCIGMCGPIALAVPTVDDSNSGRFVSTLFYNLGRVSTYALLGAVLGSIGEAFALAGWQQALSIALGIALLFFLLWPKKWMPALGSHNVFNFIRKPLYKLFQQKTYGAAYLIGLLNGLLPCGLVYLAITGAIASGTIWNGAVFMVFFGLGTLPLLWSFAFFGSYVSLRTRKMMRKAYPVIFGIMACLLILRGLGLNIPYISPGAAPTANSASIDCH